MFSCVFVRWYHDCWSYLQLFQQKLASVYCILSILCDLLQLSTKGIKSSSYIMCVMDIHNSGSLILILSFLWFINDMLQSYSQFEKSNKLPVKGLRYTKKIVSALQKCLKRSPLWIWCVHERTLWERFNVWLLMNHFHWWWKTFLETVLLRTSVCLSSASNSKLLVIFGL